MTCRFDSRFLCGAVALFLAAGCGRDDGIYTVPVTGIVTLDGQPMPEAFVGFAPIEGQAAYNVRTEQNGKFVMKYSAGIEGLPPGEYRVSIRTNTDFAPYGLGIPTVLPGQQPTKEDWQKLREQLRAPSKIPKDYHDARTSGLTANVQDGEDNDFTFELKSK